ncbi:MAG: ribonuclease III [Bacteroidota bacterium]
MLPDTIGRWVRRLRSRRAGRVSRARVEQVLGRRLYDLTLYDQALRHRSLMRNQPTGHLRSNERLEFLGDAVLGLAVAEYLYRTFPDRNEGFLTRTRSKLVSGVALSKYAVHIGLDRILLMSDDMERSNGRSNPSILADGFEALLGALYLDQGLDVARSFVLDVLDDHVDIDEVVERRENYKSLLLEHAQARGWSQPRYRVLTESGPSHNKEFRVEVLLNDQPHGRGTGRSKKKAEQRAAKEALRDLMTDL